MKSFRFKLGILLALVAGASLVSQFVYRNIVASLHESLFSSIGALESVHAAENLHAALHELLTTAILAGDSGVPGFREGYEAVRVRTRSSFASVTALIESGDDREGHFNPASEPGRIAELRMLFDDFLDEIDKSVSGVQADRTIHLGKARFLFDEIFERHLSIQHGYHTARLESQKAGADAVNHKTDIFFFVQLGILALALCAAFVFSDRVLLRGFRAAERGAFLDGLTGLKNRKYLEGPAVSEISAMINTNEPFSLIIADIDHFKRLNDTFGHQAGDTAIRETAERLRNGLRKSDTIIRYGGEEFLMILPGADKASAMATANKIRERLSMTEIALPAGERETVTASFGLVSFPEEGIGEYATLLKKADERLYAAKSGGRNKVAG